MVIKSKQRRFSKGGGGAIAGLLANNAGGKEAGIQGIVFTIAGKGGGTREVGGSSRLKSQGQRHVAAAVCTDTCLSSRSTFGLLLQAAAAQA